MKLCIIKMPSADNEALMPDLGTGMLVAINRKEGFDVSQADLKPVQRKNHYLHEDYYSISPLEAKYFLQGAESEKVTYLCERIIYKLNLNKYDILGFSLDENTKISINLAIIKELKRQIGCLVLLGGTYNFSEKHLKNFTFIDFIIRGDGTYSLSKLMKEMDKDNPSLDKVPGLVYRRNGTIKSNKYLRQMGNTEMVPDFTDLNMEDYKLTPKEIMGNYYEALKEKLPHKKTAILPYHFLKGCPNSCNFCYWSRERYFKCTDPEKVSNSLLEMKKRYRVNNFFFLNNSFNPTLTYGKRLVDSFIANDVNVNWSDSINPRSCDKTLIDKAARSGCKLLYWGIESTSKRILNLLNKPYPEQVSSLQTYIKRAHDLNIFNGVNFLVGVPYEKEEDILKTREFIKKNNKYFEFYNANLLRVFPEYPYIKDPSVHKIKLKKLGSIEQRNPSGKPELNKTLQEGGIHKKIKFYSFDELNGLKWREKNAQDIKFLNTLLKVLDKKKKLFFDSPHRIYYLSSIFDKKKDILNLYKEIGKYK